MKVKQLIKAVKEFLFIGGAIHSEHYQQSISMLTKQEMSDAKLICKSLSPTMRQVRYFTYVLYPKWLGGRYERYEYDDDKVLTHFKVAKQDFLINQPKDESNRIENR